MYHNIIKLPDLTEMHYHNFCANCHYKFLDLFTRGNFCPNCGTELRWNTKTNQSFRDWVKMSQEHYDLLLKRRK